MQSREHILDAPELAQLVTQSVREGGKFILTVTGSSMAPTLLHGRSQVELVAPGKVKPGQILLARRGNGALVLHRLIRREGEKLILNGDAQAWTERVAADRVLAKVSRICRKGRWYRAGTLADRAYCALWGVTRPLRPWLFKLYSKRKRK